MTPHARFRWVPIAFSVLALSSLLSTAGLFAPLETAFDDLRTRTLQREIDSDIVIVGIDADSLADLQQWPWPRRYHAALLDRLAAANVRNVFLDIDFSAYTNPDDDAALAAALSRFDTNPVVLPAFIQRGLTDDGLVLSLPQRPMARHARLASVNLQQGPDNLVREIPAAIAAEGASIPSVPVLLAGLDPLGAAPVAIDFTISPGSFDHVSYVDVLAGRIDPARLRGKTIFVGATAIELNDMLPVPIHRSLPGVVIQALATESARTAPAMTIPAAAHLTMIVALAAAFAFWFSLGSWRRNASILAIAAATLVGVHFYAFVVHRLVLPIVPSAFVLAGLFVVTTLRALDEQTWRALTYAIGLRKRDALLHSIVETSADGIVCIDAAGVIQTANAATTRLFDCSRYSLASAPLATFIPAMKDSATLAALAGLVTEHTAVRPDGTRVPVEISVSPLNLRGETLYTVIVRDFSEREAQRAKLRYQAMHDALTGLANRAALTSHLENVLAHASDAQKVAVLMLDLCRFKEVNDTLGHDIGDDVLREVARRFAAAAERGFIARLGGDEFAVVIDAPQDQTSLEVTASRLSSCLQAPVVVAQIAIDVGVSIGMATYPHDAKDAATLLQRADVAMYESKRVGSPFEAYDSARDRNSVRKLAMVSELRTAIAAGQLQLHYQPQVALQTGRSDSVEALLRWHHPQHGRLSPGEFIAIAESTDLIHALTEWSVAEALAQSQRWRDEGFTPRIAVNLSARVLQDVSFPDKLRAMLDATGADASRLELEITESAMMLDAARALRVVRELHALGVLLSIDDFGTGFSSLGYLRDLPVHALKLDRSFVMHLPQRSDDRVIVDSTLQMAHALKLQVVAEGVESPWTASYLRDAGYDYAQGYLYSAALTPAECRKWMMAFNALVPNPRANDPLARLAS